MKILIITIIAYFLSDTLNAQEFSFNMCFEDALGNKDTIVLGYDSEATDSIDIAFGELDINKEPFNKTFEVRISDSWKIFFFSVPFLTEKQITKNICDLSINCVKFSLLMKCNNFPVCVKWDRSLFNDDCRIRSLITDWNPGSWFDAGIGTEQGPFYLKDSDSIEFTHTTEKLLYNYNGITDTLNLLFITIASEKNIVAGIQKSKISDFRTFFNNPASNLLKIKTLEGKIISVALYDIFGRNVLTSNEIDAIDVSSLNAGLYILKINFEDFSLTDKLFIL